MTMKINKPPMPPSEWIEKEVALVLQANKNECDTNLLARRIAQHIVNNWQMICLIGDGGWYHYEEKEDDSAKTVPPRIIRLADYINEAR